MKNKLKWSWVLTKRLLKMDDPLFEDGNIICCLSMKQFTLKEDIAELLERDADIKCGIGTCNKVFKSLVEYESHYNSVHKNVCSICKRFYPSNHLLDIHLLEWHDSMFELLSEKQPMFQCLIPTCSTKSSNRKQRKDHMIKVHKYPSNFRFDREKKSVCKSKLNSQTKANDTLESVSMEVVDDKENSPISKSKIQYSYRVPQNFSFGHGVSRGFQPRKRGRGRGGKSKHWHNQSKENMQVDIEKVDMNDLAEALDTT